MKFLKDKKGFSLTELIAVLVILSILITLGVAIYMNTRNSVLNKSYENLKTYLEAKAIEYANETSITTISVEDLIKNGYVIPDDQTDIYNPINRESMNCFIIKSKFVDGEYIAELSENLDRDSEGKCNEYTQTSDFQICRFDEEKNECFDIAENYWFNDNIYLKVKKINVDLTNAKYSWSNNMGFSDDKEIIKTNVASVSSSIYKCEIVLSNNENGVATKKIQIDKEPPQINEIIFDKNVSTKKIVEIIASDGTGSGIGGYKIVKNGEACEGTFEKDNKINVTEKGNYTICVKDKAGNVAKKENIDITSIDNTQIKITSKGSDTIFVGVNNETISYFNVEYPDSGGYVICDPETTGKLKVGKHTLKCTAYRNNGTKAEATSELTVKSRIPSTPKIVAKYENRNGAVYTGALTNKSIFVSFEPGEETDLVTNYYYKYGNGSWQSPSWISMNNSVGTFTYTTDIDKTIYIKACYKDESGEKCSGSSSGQALRIDKTSPTCKLSIGSTVSIGNKSSDVAKYGVSRSSTISYGTSSLRTSTGTFYGYVEDAAGNPGSCSASVISTTEVQINSTCSEDCSTTEKVCTYVCYRYMTDEEKKKNKCNGTALEPRYDTCWRWSSTPDCKSPLPYRDRSKNATQCKTVNVPNTCYVPCVKTSYTCSSGYSKANNSYCYKLG